MQVSRLFLVTMVLLTLRQILLAWSQCDVLSQSHPVCLSFLTEMLKYKRFAFSAK